MGKSFFHRCRLLISFIKFHLYIICQTKVSCHCCLYKVVAEQKARTTYDNILRLVKDPEVCEPIRFLREREIVHYQRFGETNREDCSKNSKVSKAHNYGTFEQILTIRKFTGRRHKPPYFLYISKNDKVKQYYTT